MDRPVVGICTSLEMARYGAWNQPTALTPYGYVLAIQRAGALALMLPPDPLAVSEPDLWLDLVDGLVLAGGVDLDPSTYGAALDPHTTGTVLERDEFELALAARAMERDIPFLGICRGMQVMNVARGGTLIQHLPDVVGSDDHRRNTGTFEGNDHRVVLDDGSLAARAAGETDHRTLSHHHQAVDALGDGLVVTGRAVGDDLAEALEDPTRRFALGVQWHPEADETSRVIAALVDEAARSLGLRPRIA